MTGNMVQHKTRVSLKYSTLHFWSSSVLSTHTCHYRTNGDDALLVECYMKYNTPKWLLTLTNLAEVQIFTLMSSFSQILQVERQNKMYLWNTESWICKSMPQGCDQVLRQLWPCFAHPHSKHLALWLNSIKKQAIHRMQIWRTTRSAPGTSPMKVRLVRLWCFVLTMLPQKDLVLSSIWSVLFRCG